MSHNREDLAKAMTMISHARLHDTIRPVTTREGAVHVPCHIALLISDPIICRGGGMRLEVLFAVASGKEISVAA